MTKSFTLLYLIQLLVITKSVDDLQIWKDELANCTAVISTNTNTVVDCLLPYPQASCSKYDSPQASQSQSLDLSVGAKPPMYIHQQINHFLTPYLTDIYQPPK